MYSVTLGFGFPAPWFEFPGQNGAFERAGRGRGLGFRAGGLVLGQGACGIMDNASDYESEDSRFVSWHARG